MPLRESFSSYMNVIYRLRSVSEQAMRHALAGRVAPPHACARFRCSKHGDSESKTWGFRIQNRSTINHRNHRHNHDIDISCHAIISYYSTFSPHLWKRCGERSRVKLSEEKKSENHGTDEANRIWSSCAQNIRSQLSTAVWDTTFSLTEAASFNRNSLILQVPTALHKMRIESRYLQILQEAVEDTTPGATVSIEVNRNKIPKNLRLSRFNEPIQINNSKLSTHQKNNSVERSAHNASHNNNDNDSSNYSSPTSDNKPININSIIKTSKSNHKDIDNRNVINSRFTFEQFVTGSSNRFAHAAALAVAEQPANDYNPLFIHGDSGMGKTHLLQAIANYSINNYPQHKMRYVTSETFLNEFVRAIRNNTQPDFKQQYRYNKMLLVDDIQFLQDKDGLQEEFFHTFNDIFQNGGQIVLSSDRPPDAIPKLEDRLRSRFRSGLITDIQPPDLVTRLAILQKKVESKKVHIQNDVLNFIAEHITNSIRELEGALIKIVAYTNLHGQHCSLDQAKQLLSDLINSTAKIPVTIDLVIDTACDMFNFSRDLIVGTSRRQPLVRARQIAMYTTRDLTELSYPQIGKGFGNRDHTTVMHACRKIQDQIANNKEVFNQVQELQNRIAQAR